MKKVFTKSLQLIAISKEMIGNGYTNVMVQTEGSSVNLPNMVLDIVADFTDHNGNAKKIIIEMLDDERMDAVERWDTISEMIADRPEIDFEIRCYDAAQKMMDAWVALRRKIAKKIKTGEDIPAYESVLDMMDSLKVGA